MAVTKNATRVALDIHTVKRYLQIAEATLHRRANVAAKEYGPIHGIVQALNEEANDLTTALANLQRID